MNTVPLNRRMLALGMGVSLLAATLMGCASAPSSAPLADAGADSAALLSRAQAYWGLIKANDKLAAWPYEARSLDPNWTVQAYLQRGGITYNAVEVKSVKQIDGDSAVVVVAVDYAVPMVRVKSVKGEMDDMWKRIDGVWYHNPARRADAARPAPAQ